MAMFDGRKNSGHPTITAVLDIGTSKTVCFIGCDEPGVGVRILGAGVHASIGIKAGAIVDMEQAEHSIRHAVEKAERAAGLAISSVVVNVSTRSLRSRHFHIDGKISNAEVTDRDLKRVIDTGLAEFDDPSHAILHALPLNWTVDEERGVRDPRGMFGHMLGVDLHLVTSSVGVLRNMAHCVERCHLRIAGIVVSPYAAGLGVLVEDELDLGVTLIDMGGGVTTVAVFHDRTLAFVDAVGVGGGNVTSDLASGVITTWEAAERIKTIYGSALESPHDDGQMVPCPPMGAQDELHHEPQSLVTDIVRARIEETFEILRDRLTAAGVDGFSGRRIVFTGGAAELTGVPQLAEYIFKKRARIGRPHGLSGLPESMSGPEFAVASGLIKQIYEHKPEVPTGPPNLSGRRIRTKRYVGGGFGRSLRWFKENF